MKRIFTIALVLAAMMANAFGQTPEALKVKEFTLDNGMKVWINEDPGQTAVYGAVVVKAGAVDCPGTGIAHYFEHMMFKGTDKIGTIDYAAEKPYLDSIAVKYDELALTADDSLRHDIQMEINRLSIKAADFAIPNEFNTLISEMGGSSLNAFTSYDETVYHNMFLPEYFEQWAELNSERIMNPVFRLFQSELETVYEEKNRSEDNLISDFQNQMLANVFAGTGYSEQIIGTTENLKNPRLSQMREFFEQYYVAGNMGLVLTGNITAEKALPVIKKTFGRIREGEAPAREVASPASISGCKDVEAMVNMPLVKLGALCFRGPSKCDEDYLGMSLVASMLNNDAGTGLLDKLMVDGKLMMAMAMPDLSFKDAGSIMVMFMPKLLFQKEQKALGHIMNAIDSIKEGDFSDEYFESCKLSFKKQKLSELEDLGSRVIEMVFTFSDGLSWDEAIAASERIDAMTKEDIVALANKYFTEDYIYIHKKKGLALKDNLQKPDYEKVVPPNKDAASAYATALRSSAANINVRPRTIDYENDVKTLQAAPLATLYASANPYNDVFDLTISYRTGTNDCPALERVAGYVNLLGTSDKSFDEIHSALQALGGSIGFGVDDDSFNISISGFDSNFTETISIASDLVNNIKGDKKKLRRCKSEEKSGLIMNRSDMDALERALFSKVVYGDNSSYLADKGDYSDKNLLGLFEDLRKIQCDVLYSGTLDAADVATAVSSAFDFESISTPAEGIKEFSPITYDSPQVFFVDKKDASQCQIRAVVTTDPIPTQRDRYSTSVYSTYLGGGMSSLLFQEIREFRSMAYSTGSALVRPVFCNTQTIPAVFFSYVGTQADKTFDAMYIVDSLMTKTPYLDSRINIVRKEMLNSRCNAYPSFRELPAEIAYDKRCGYTEDPAELFVEVIGSTCADSLKETAQKYFEGRNTVWTVVGSSKKLDLSGLEKYGPVTIYKATDVLK